MGRSINHYDYQDNLINKNNRLSQRSSNHEDQDLSSMSIQEQEKAIKKKLDAKKKADEAKPKPKRTIIISHYIPKYKNKT